MTRLVLALDYLSHPDKTSPVGVCVLFGDEPYLKRLCLDTLKGAVLAGRDSEFSFRSLAGNTAEIRDVLDELRTVSLFGSGRRFVVVDDADGFVSRYRTELEDYVSAPSDQGVLLLDVTAWAANTRLYKSVDQHGLAIDCRPPAEGKLAAWLVRWCKKRHGAELASDAAGRLVEMLGPQMGVLDQELAKLSCLAPPGGKITAALVEEAVGGWRAKTTWAILDAMLAGDARTAIQELDHLIVGGEHPISVLAQFASSLRRFAAATRLVVDAESAGRKPSLRTALEQAGVKPFVIAKSETQLRRLGRQRGQSLHEWLVETDLALKGTSSSPAMARAALERLVIRLASPPEEQGRRATVLQRRL